MSNCLSGKVNDHVKYTIMTESNHFRPFHQHNDKCLERLGQAGMDLGDQVRGYCSAVKHSADCASLTELDLFRKREKETRQLVALQEPGV